MEDTDKMDVYASDKSVSPVGIRYGRPEMVRIFGESNTLRYILETEANMSSAISDLHPDIVPPEAAKDIIDYANLEHVDLERVKEFERQTHHDIMAVVKAISEQCTIGEGYVHFTLTSADITETQKAIQLKEGLEVMIPNIENTRDVLLNRAEEWKNIPCIVRSHGQHAIPGTFGLPFTYFATRLQKSVDRLYYDYTNCLEGKVSGAVGTYASAEVAEIDGMRVEEEVCKRLGIQAPIVSSQIPPRENHAYIMSDLAVLSGTLSDAAHYIRTLKRTEIGEFTEKRKGTGSSTMAHKKNPHVEERIESIGRVMRGFAQIQLESVESDYARSLATSLSDRIVIPEGFVLADYSTALLANVVERAILVPKNIETNLYQTNGIITSERVMTELVGRGLGRQDAHTIMEEVADSIKDKVMDKTITDHDLFGKALIGDGRVLEYLSEEDVLEFSDPANYIGKSKEVIDRASRQLKGKRSFS